MHKYTFRIFDLSDGAEVEVEEHAGLLGFTPNLEVVFVERDYTDKEKARRLLEEEQQDIQEDLLRRAVEYGKKAQADADELEKELDEADS